MSGAPDTRALVASLRTTYLPRSAVLLRAPEEPSGLSEIAPWTNPLQSIDGRATAYVCRHYSCELPVTDAAALLDRLSLDR